MRNRAPFDGQTHGRNGAVPKPSDDQARATPPRPPREVTSEPWLAPNGERLVAIVNDRYLTKPDMDGRIQLALRHAEPIKSTEPQLRKQLEEDRWDSYAQEIMEGWVMMTTLALESERAGFRVTDKEIDEALSQLAQGSEMSVQEVSKGIMMMGVQENKLRGEVRDGLLVEKLVMDTVRNYGEQYLRGIYDADPAFFAIAPRVHAFHIFRFTDATMTGPKQKEVMKDMERLRRELKKSDADLKTLARASETDAGISSGDMGWVSADATINPEMFKALFQLEPGQTSEIFRTDQGLHIVKVLEREEGSGMGFEKVRPQVENFMFEKTKPAVYQAVMGRYTIRMNAGGLNRWREVGAPALANSTAAAPLGKSVALPDPAAEPGLPRLPDVPSGLSNVEPPPPHINSLLQSSGKAQPMAAPSTAPAAPEIPPGASLKDIYRRTRPRSTSEIIR